MAIDRELTSAELRAARKNAGYNQTELGDLSGCARGAVSYWENQRGQLRDSPVLNQILEVLNLKHLKYYAPINAHAGGWGFTDYEQEWIDRQIQREMQRLKEREQNQAAKMRVRCRAKTRKGRPCKLMSEAGRKRCKFHGGMSTGPRTPEGKARVAAAQRLRWQGYRDAKG